MSNITINSKNHTIEINKTFAKNASLFGTREYEALQSARRDYPTYHVITITRKGAKPEHKGLTYEYMEKYITKHDDENTSKMAEYLTLRGLDEKGNRINEQFADYATIKDWFFQTFPEIEEYHKKHEDLVKKIAQRKAEMLEKKAA